MKIDKSNVAVVAIYLHVELYPPSLNALFHLADRFDKIYVLVRNVVVTNWTYPNNVELVVVGEFINVADSTKVSLLRKILSYIRFGIKMRELIYKCKPNLVLVYDTPAFALYNLSCSKRLARNIFLWYHSHDVSVKAELSRFSIVKWFLKIERGNFNRINLFTLPTSARLAYFSIKELKNPPVILPNYPSKFFFGKYQSNPQMGDVVKIIFQGHISSLMKLEEFVRVLPMKPLGKNVELHLVGPISEEYKKKIIMDANSVGVANLVFFYGRISYRDLPKLTAACHIGIAVYPPHNSMTKTMGTASNKIFEYASVGLPVLLNDRVDFRSEFGRYEWIRYLKNIQAEEIYTALECVINNYNTLSKQALQDFGSQLNYESVFDRIDARLDKAL